MSTVYLNCTKTLVVNVKKLLTQYSLRYGHWEFDHDPVSTWATQIGLGVFFFCEEGGGRQSYEG